MSTNEAHARLKINKLLEESDWKLVDSDGVQKNVTLESKVEICQKFGEDFYRLKAGFADYLLLDEKNFPICVVEAKAEGIHPLAGKEQARTYATHQNCRFIILSNGNLHYLWDLWIGSPRVIHKFPKLEEIRNFEEFKPTAKTLVNEDVGSDYIAKTQSPTFDQDPRFKDETLRSKFLEDNKLRLLRHYQIRAIQRIQEEVKNGKDRFLFEMATGTGKTLTSAAVIKLFLRSGNARRVLFLVDRLELEDQADKAFKEYLKNDYQCVIYKENRNDWRRAEIVVSTVQSFLINNKYKRFFSPTDFDLVISDEAHRSIGGNSRAVFEYFIGYKLGLTATPKDYLKNVNLKKSNERDPRELERRMLLDTYSIFGCENGDPTYRYSLIDGVKDGYLVNPIVVDARTEITTQLLSDKGYAVAAQVDPTTTPQKDSDEQKFFSRDFERKFFSETTNRIFCETFISNALRDPITGEIGKSILFCVSQNHASKVTNILNEIADQLFPGKYMSDFAVQVTSWVGEAQQMTINFTNNNLNGSGAFNPLYKTSKTRVCVTVGMMTTGYDCPDLLNVCLMRPIFSPTDFVQIKGRGTRKHNFLSNLFDKELKEQVLKSEKQNFKLFDFFANCEYFEEKFDYDEVVKLPAQTSGESSNGGGGGGASKLYENFNLDPLKSITEAAVGADGMKVDRRLFERFEDKVKTDHEIQQMVRSRDFEKIEKYILDNLFDKPDDYYNLQKLRTSLKIDRRVSLREIVEKIFGFIPYFKSKDELLEEEFEKFDGRYTPDESDFGNAKNFFKSYLADSEFRKIVESKKFGLLRNKPNGDSFFNLPKELRELIPEYIKDNVSFNRFME